MKTQDCNYKDSFIFVREFEWRNLDTNPKKCPICGEMVKDKDTVLLIGCNNKFFPNVVIHNNCFHKELPEDTFMVIENRYKEFKELDNIF